MITNADLEGHFLHLCAANEIQISWCKRPSKALAISGEFELVRVPHIRSPTAYAIALHELGHIKGRNQYNKNQIVRERWAWEWARRNAVLYDRRFVRKIALLLGTQPAAPHCTLPDGQALYQER
ncbi:hypothetical protein CK489_02665 [Bradyrhizobium sp. UFLA03-84]|uniref:hypothetical protein n=1 Tax=Bradyrhizobium sp. UFLA03-84 TaxID=418599 RepID=UPI000BAE5299|nr:hypothetical protein [Bradyrhizobium sp. UFLA03-84]PAY10614.1 hypothetical protein CK489_02665 [Bradyrhizobium sp. UFLA03-84]